MFFQDPPDGPTGSAPRPPPPRPNPSKPSRAMGSSVEGPGAIGATFVDLVRAGGASSSRGGGGEEGNPVDSEEEEEDSSMETRTEMDITPTEQGKDLRLHRSIPGRSGSLSIGKIGQEDPSAAHRERDRERDRDRDRDVDMNRSSPGEAFSFGLGGGNGKISPSGSTQSDPFSPTSSATSSPQLGPSSRPTSNLPGRKPSFRLPPQSFGSNMSSSSTGAYAGPMVTEHHQQDQMYGNPPVISPPLVAPAHGHIPAPTTGQASAQESNRFGNRNFSDHRQRRSSIPDTPNELEGNTSGDEHDQERDGGTSDGEQAMESGNSDGDANMDGTIGGTGRRPSVTRSSGSGISLMGPPTHLPSISSPPPPPQSGSFNNLYPPASPSSFSRNRPNALPPPAASPSARRSEGALDPFSTIAPHSPWAYLARTSGAPTPRTERPGGPDPFSAFFAGQSAGEGSSDREGPTAQGFELGQGKDLRLGGPSVRGSPPTPSSGRMNAPDPFASFSIGAGGPSGVPSNSNGESMNALLARRRGSRTGLSGLSNSRQSTRSPSEERIRSEGAEPTSQVSSPTERPSSTGSSSNSSEVTARAVPQGAIYGQGRRVGTGSLDALAVPNAAGTGMKLNFPGGIAARRTPNAGSGSVSSSAASSTTSLSLPVTVQIPMPLSPSALTSILAGPGSTLVLDLRPPSSFTTGHVPSSMSLPISSTLIKRPGFTLSKLADMLAPSPAQTLKRFRECSDIVIIDQDSSAAPANSNLAGMASKFANAPRHASITGSTEFTGKIWFLRGGIAGCSGVPGLDLVAGDEEVAEGDTQPHKSVGSVGEAGSNNRTLQPSNSGMLIGGLDKIAFQQASIKGLPVKRAIPTKSATLPATPGLGGNKLNLRLPGQISQPIAPSGRPTSPRAEQGPDDSLQPANPFFDNIRQNLELSHGGITERIPLQLGPDILARAAELPAFLRELVEGSEEEAADALAKEFESVERNEQRRLQGIMEWHSKGCSRLEDLSTPGPDVPGTNMAANAHQRKVEKLEVFPRDLKRMNSKGQLSQTNAWDEHGSEDGQNYFPFSITAGVERGSKNRYKNIWPYDFSRVRLATVKDGSDYINANYIQPYGTSRRYIATQGPLDATFEDFWTLVWEQDINVIVMLTKQFEGGSIKCGSYWTDGKYGPMDLELVSTEGESAKETVPTTGFNFPAAPSMPHEGESSTIRRHFLLSNARFPQTRKRHITQVQCLAWPDFDVPSDPRTLLTLLKDVDHAGEDMATQNGQAGPVKPPVLIHCSAGVGRTGGYIVVDAVLDGLRREHSLHSRKIRGSVGSSRLGSRNHSIADGNEALLSRRGSENSDVFMISPPVDKSTEMPGVISASPDLIFMEPSKEAGTGTSRSSEIDPFAQRAQLDGFDVRIDSARSPTPMSGVSDPVKHVLEGMRIQRMSLCQSLRQYLFVYRAIIIGYLDMLDEERDALHEDVSRPPMQYGSASSGGTTDDEGHHKRRASPTDFSEARLQKRPSIKLRSPAAKAARSTAQSADWAAGPQPASNRTTPPISPASDVSPHPITGEFHRTKSSLSNLAAAMDSSE